MSSTVWTDASGNNRITLLRTTSGAGSLLSLIEPLVNSDWLECWEGPQSTQVPSPLTGQYENAGTAAKLNFLCADGTIASVVLFAPRLDIFLTDQVTVNPANTDVLSLITGCIGNLRSATGALAVSYLSGTIGPRPQGAG